MRVSITKERHEVFVPGEPFECACCGGTNWHIGRVTAECANPECQMPVPMKEPTSTGQLPLMVTKGEGHGKVYRESGRHNLQIM